MQCTVRLLQGEMLISLKVHFDNYKFVLLIHRSSSVPSLYTLDRNLMRVENTDLKILVNLIVSTGWL